MKIDVIGGVPTDDGLLSIGKYIVNSVADEVKKEARAGKLGELIGRIGATGDLMKTGDNIGDEVIEGLKQTFLDHKMGSVYVYSEEEGVYRLIDAGDQGFFMVIDPLDGSNNLRIGAPSPYVSVSVALGRLSDLSSENTFDSIKVGVVRDIFNHRLYHAVKGEEVAYAHDMHDDVTSTLRTYDTDIEKIKIYTETDLEKSVLGIDLDGGKADATMNERLNELYDLLVKKGCQRRLGSSILDFCKVASGEYDGFVTLGGRMRLHDLAAAKLIVEEAGGVFELNNPYEGNLLEHAFRTSTAARDDVARLLRDTKFKVVASANPTLHSQIMSYVNL